MDSFKTVQSKKLNKELLVVEGFVLEDAILLTTMKFVHP